VRSVGACVCGGGGVTESGGRFCVGAFGRDLVSVVLRMYSHLMYFMKKFYKSCTFNSICKDNTAINCISLLLNTKKVHTRQL
jgi:hypothetical protein